MSLTDTAVTGNDVGYKPGVSYRNHCEGPSCVSLGANIISNDALSLLAVN